MTESADQPVTYDVVEGVATITLNRPDAMNSLNVATKEALLAALRKVADDPAVRCVVLTGNGRAFCVGQDLKEHVQLLESGGSDQLFRTVEEHYNPTVTALATMAGPDGADPFSRDRPLGNGGRQVTHPQDRIARHRQ